MTYLTSFQNKTYTNKNKYSLKHPDLPRKMWFQGGFKPTPLAFQVSTLTTRPLTPPSPWHPQPRVLSKARTEVLDFDLLSTSTAVFYYALSTHLSSVHLHIAHLCICDLHIYTMEAPTSS